MPGTAARHRALRSIILDSPVASQGVLAERLSDRGFEVTQATVSRDLQALGAVKGRDASGTLRYLLATDVGDGDEAEAVLGRALSTYAESIEVSGTLVVVKTPPGAAHVVAAAIDAHGLAGTIGTVAGDDTMLIVASESAGGLAIADELERIGGGR